MMNDFGFAHDPSLRHTDIYNQWGRTVCQRKVWLLRQAPVPTHKAPSYTQRAAREYAVAIEQQSIGADAMRVEHLTAPPNVQDPRLSFHPLCLYVHMLYVSFCAVNLEPKLYNGLLL